jgi:hypothetical protein
MSAEEMTNDEIRMTMARGDAQDENGGHRFVASVAGFSHRYS